MNIINFFKLTLDNPVSWVIVFFLLAAIITPIYYYVTRFNKTVVVKKVYDYNKSRNSRGLMFEDTESNIYTVNNLWFKGEYDSMEDWNKLSVGGTYLIEGYGKRIPILNMYPRVYKITQK